MGFNDIKKKVINCVEQGKAQSTPRSDKNEKNLFLTGDKSKDDVVSMLNKTKGTQYTSIHHDTVPDVEVHIFKPLIGDEEWYIKFYFIDPNCFFISVHFSKKIVQKKKGK